MRPFVVIPVGADRHENVAQVLECLWRQEGIDVELVVVVQDGPMEDVPLHEGLPMIRVRAPKHEPGLEQPRNIGVRAGMEWLGSSSLAPDYVIFLDSDILVAEDWLRSYYDAWASTFTPADIDRILIGPYVWMAPGEREIGGKVMLAEQRQAMFDTYGPEHTFRGDLSAGLACFSGNLAWPLKEFVRVGGFWSELHHGRCEDGELGARAVAMGVPIGLAAGAKGWHMDHPRNHSETLRRNARDVPMLDARHPWIQGHGVFMVDRDGKAFDVECPVCECQVPTIEWWQHAADAGHQMELELSSR
jgi:hypothetical protein